MYQAWMLPEGVSEALLAETQQIDALEQLAMRLFSRWGYQRLRPPMMEYLDALVSDSHDSLFDQTIQFKDQVSGKQLAIRADITPQIARIDQHYLKTDKVSRYSYCGEVVRAYPTGQNSIRNPIVAGVELFGSIGWQADAEVMLVLLDFLAQAGISNPVLSIGNVDIACAILTAEAIDTQAFAGFFAAFATRDSDEIKRLCAEHQVGDTQAILALLSFQGDLAILADAKQQYQYLPAVQQAIEQIEQVIDAIHGYFPEVPIHLDLSDVFGFGYHNGLIFAAYKAGEWQELARGGRYDHAYANKLEQHTRQSRAATGFSCHLNVLSKWANQFDKQRQTTPKIIRVSLPISAELMQLIRQLRETDVVIQEQAGEQMLQTATHEIIYAANGQYQILEITV